MKTPAHRFRALATVLLAVATAFPVTLPAAENDWFVPLGPPPKAAPRRVSGGEGFAPLPLPVTPLRRSERKREPGAPKLVGKVIWGESANYSFESGSETRIADWNLCPADVQSLLHKVERSVGVKYSHEQIQLEGFHGDPARTPVLLFSGVRAIRFNEPQLALLRNYVLRGGMIVADSIAGSPYFTESFRAALEQAFPELRMRLIPKDHPIYNMHYSVDTVTYPKNHDGNQPLLEGLYVGSRVGVLISPYGMGVGWDNRQVPYLEKAVFYDVRSASELGVNIVAYAIGYARVGLVEGKPEIFGAMDERDPTDEFVVGQIRHEGAWNVHPGAFSAILRRMRQDTALRVSLKRVPITPGKESLAPYTFLYLSGLDNFTFDDAGIAGMRNFLLSGGTLFINNGLGLSTFDAAARRELSRILPDAQLEPVPLNHALYRSVFQIGQASYSPLVMKRRPDLAAPYLEGIMVNGDLRVIYSPFDLEAGWQGEQYPLAQTFQPGSAMQIGVNLLMYGATH